MEFPVWVPWVITAIITPFMAYLSKKFHDLSKWQGEAMKLISSNQASIAAIHQCQSDRDVMCAQRVNTIINMEKRLDTVAGDTSRILGILEGTQRHKE